MTFESSGPYTAWDVADQYFSMGHCHLLALHLHERYELPLVGVFLIDDCDPDAAPAHVAVELPGDRFLDIVGIQTEAQLTEGLPLRTEVRRIHPEDVVGWMDTVHYSTPTNFTGWLLRCVEPVIDQMLVSAGYTLPRKHVLRLCFYDLLPGPLEGAPLPIPQ